MKLKYHSKDGTLIEIEGEPSELAHFTHELDTRKAGGSDHPSETKQAIIDISVDLLTRKKMSDVQSDDIARYIASLERSDMAHTIEDLMLRFLGVKLHSKKQQSAYLSFYSKVKGAHKILASEKNGTWEPSKARGGRNTIYKFVKN